MAERMANRVVQPHLAAPLVARQHALIEWLRICAPKRVSAAALAVQLGVATRTVERDVARLQAAGVPIDVRHGPGGGYSIDARSRLDPLVLTPGEAAAMIAALTAVGPFASATAQSALDKLIGALTKDASGACRRGESSGRRGTA